MTVSPNTFDINELVVVVGQAEQREPGAPVDGEACDVPYCKCSYGGRSSIGRAPDCGSGGRGFEPRRSPQQFIYNLCAAPKAQEIWPSGRRFVPEFVATIGTNTPAKATI